ncbi:MAG: extracellular solute-binding protein [Solobacterium sp.]|nr:extracellular solute-binding protein [Solobacterium sp.]
MSKKDKTVSGIILSIILLLVFVGIYRLNIFKNQIVLKVGIHSGDYWDNPNGNYYETLDFAIEKFEAAHENVKVEYVSGIGADDYSEWLSEQIVKGEEPDVFLVLPEDFSLFAPAGILADLDQMIWDDASYSRKNFYSPCIKAGTYNDTQYALPYESVPTVMFVNKTLLAEKGIPFPDSNWSWEDFYEICKQVTDLEEHEYGVYDYSWLDAMYTNGMTLFSEDGKTCNLSKEKVKEAIQFVIDLEALNEGYTVSSKDLTWGKWLSILFCTRNTERISLIPGG